MLSPKILAVAAALWLCGLAAGLAEEWTGPAAVSIEVTDEDGRPVEGARIAMGRSDTETPVGPAAMVTDSRGRALVQNLAEGEWYVEITHDAYMLYAAYVKLRAGKKPIVGFSSQVNSSTSWKPLRVKFLRAQGTERRSRKGRATPPPPPPPPAAERPRSPRPPGSTRRTEAARIPEVVRPESSPPANPTEAPAPPEDEAPASEERPRPAPVAPLPPPSPVTAPPEVEPVATPPEPEPVATPSEPQPVATPPEPEPAGELASAPPAEVSESPPSAPPPAPPTPEVVTPDQAPTTPEPEQPEGLRPEPGTSAVAPPEREPATPRPEEPVPRYLRSAAAGSCPECREGEWAITVESLAHKAMTISRRNPCPTDLEAARSEILELLQASAADLAGFAGPLSVAMWRISDVDARNRLRRRLTEATDPASTCQVLLLVLPAEGAFSGYALEAWDSLGGGACAVGTDCALGQARWLGEPRVLTGDALTLVSAAFINRSTRRERRAKLTVYFRPPAGWRPR